MKRHGGRAFPPHLQNGRPVAKVGQCQRSHQTPIAHITPSLSRRLLGSGLNPIFLFLRVAYAFRRRSSLKSTIPTAVRPCGLPVTDTITFTRAQFRLVSHGASNSLPRSGDAAYWLPRRHHGSPFSGEVVPCGEAVKAGEDAAGRQDAHVNRAVRTSVEATERDSLLGQIAQRVRLDQNASTVVTCMRHGMAKRVENTRTGSGTTIGKRPPPEACTSPNPQRRIQRDDSTHRQNTPISPFGDIFLFLVVPLLPWPRHTQRPTPFILSVASFPARGSIGKFTTFPQRRRGHGRDVAELYNGGLEHPRGAISNTQDQPVLADGGEMAHLIQRWVAQGTGDMAQKRVLRLLWRHRKRTARALNIMHLDAPSPLVIGTNHRISLCKQASEKQVQQAGYVLRHSNAAPRSLHSSQTCCPLQPGIILRSGSPAGRTQELHLEPCPSRPTSRAVTLRRPRCLVLAAAERLEQERGSPR